MNGCPVPPSAPAAWGALIEFALAGAACAWAVRPMLRSPLLPRWLSVVIVSAAPAVVLVFTRQAVSYQQYRQGFREGGWVFVWDAVELAAYIAVVLAGGIIPLPPPTEAPRTPPGRFSP